jgi:hypothetical protein
MDPAMERGMDPLKAKSAASMTNGAIHSLALMTKGRKATGNKEKANVAIEEADEAIRMNFQ